MKNLALESKKRAADRMMAMKSGVPASSTPYKNTVIITTPPETKLKENFTF